MRWPVKKIGLVVLGAWLVTACQFKPLVPQNSLEEAAELNAQLSLAYLTQQHDVARAKQKILLAQQQAPRDPVVWYVTGYFLESTHEPVAAEQAYQRAMKLAPRNGATHNNYGAFL